MHDNENEVEVSPIEDPCGVGASPPTDPAQAEQSTTIEERQAEEFADEMHAEPRNIDGEPDVATPEEEAAADAEGASPSSPIEERQAEEFADEMHAEPRNIDGEAGVATPEQEAAAGAEGASPSTTIEERQAEEFADEMHAEPRNIDGEPDVATPEEEAAAGAEGASPSTTIEERQAEEFADEMHAEPRNIDGEPGVATTEEEAAAGAEGFGPPAEPAQAQPEPDSPAPSDALSADEILAPDAGKEQPKWPAEDAELMAMLEAVIYITDEPLTLEQISTALEQPRDRIKRLLNDLVAEWQKPHHGLSIREVAGGYKMTTKPEHHEAVRQFVKSLKPPMKLSLPALETLAVIAYKQPVTAPEIMEIRGVQGAGVLKTLIDRKLIAAAGRKNVLGKPILYKTTKEFLVQFGLKDLSELPSVKEFEELARFASPEPASEAPASEAPASEAAHPPAPPEVPQPDPAPEAAPEPVPETVME